MEAKMKDVALEKSHAGRHIALVQYVLLIVFLVTAGMRSRNHKATRHEYKCRKGKMSLGARKARQTFSNG